MIIPIAIAALWVGNNYRLAKKEKRPVTAAGLVLGPLLNLTGGSKK